MINNMVSAVFIEKKYISKGKFRKSVEKEIFYCIMCFAKVFLGQFSFHCFFIVFSFYRPLFLHDNYIVYTHVKKCLNVGLITEKPLNLEIRWAMHQSLH